MSCVIRPVETRQNIQVEESVTESDVGKIECNEDAGVAPEEQKSVYFAESVRYDSTHHLVPYVMLMLDKY